eukprot:TRINITY_DN4879_c0_g3_i1.p1 TRINITY_DN4879_c0_g3~~TRINITY_DN4879_c0_g3_i1.p1  ORF type:complete len:132 (+),score=10.38 TRINITY_DN4879_c0_g3_i1:457-852(+)
MNAQVIQQGTSFKLLNRDQALKQCESKRAGAALNTNTHFKTSLLRPTQKIGFDRFPPPRVRLHEQAREQDVDLAFKVLAAQRMPPSGQNQGSGLHTSGRLTQCERASPTEHLFFQEGRNRKASIKHSRVRW